MSTIPLPQGMTTFDARQVEPNAAFEPIPTGWYPVKIIKSEMKPTNAKDGSYLELEVEVLSGEFAGRKGWDRLNLVNGNPTAVEIAYRTLSAICHATGVININDSSQLHGIPLQARFVLVAPRTVDNKNYDASNDIRGYKAIDAANGAAVAGTPPWTPTPVVPTAATKPDGWAPPSTTPPPWEAPKAVAPATQPPTAAPSPFPPEAIEWAKANPTHPQAADILKTLPAVVQPQPAAAAPWGKPPAPAAPAASGKPPWVKA